MQDGTLWLIFFLSSFPAFNGRYKGRKMENYLLARRSFAVDTQQRPKKKCRPSWAEEGEKKEVVSVNKSLMVVVVSRRNIEAT